MSKAILISIRPEWCEKILSGEKTIEIRKTRPKMETPFKCYIYCTNTGRPLVWGDVSCESGWMECYTQTYGWSRKDVDRIWGSDVLSGKVIGEFACDSIYPVSFYASDSSFFDDAPPLTVPGTCLTDREIAEYLGNGKTGYGWHISDLKIYDQPTRLNDFMKEPCDFAASCGACRHAQWGDGHTFEGCELNVQRAPQSWCYVEELT